VVLLPLNLARSQWDQLVPVLAQQYCTITLSGAFLGFVPILEERMRGGYNAVVRALVDAAGPRPGDTLLEVGCGSGAIARWLARYTAGANEITAVDVNGYLLREATFLARAEGLADRITFLECNAEALALPDNSVDVSLSFTVMEEVDADRMLQEMIRVTKPGGRVGVLVRAADMQLWTNLPVRPELLAKIKSSPSAGAADQGCADVSLYQRFRAAGLHELSMGPQLATHKLADGAEFLRLFAMRILHGLVGEEAEECRAVLTRAIDDGTFLWADPYHSAVGRKS
jgi:SAM-dependent methyltransferase